MKWPVDVDADVFGQAGMKELADAFYLDDDALQELFNKNFRSMNGVFVLSPTR